MKRLIGLLTFILIISYSFADNTLDKKLLSEVRYGHIETVIKLIKKGADVNAKDKYDFTPLHEAIEYQSFIEGEDVIIAKIAKIVKILISHGANVNAKDKNDSTPLNIAIKEGYVKIVKILISHGVNVNAKNRHGYTPLHIAAGSECPEVVRLLINAGADVNAEINIKEEKSGRYIRKGYTPLHIAAGSRCPEIVKLLINSGADVNAKYLLFNRSAPAEISDAPPLDCARMKEIAELLINAGADINATVSENDCGSDSSGSLLYRAVFSPNESCGRARALLSHDAIVKKVKRKRIIEYLKYLEKGHDHDWKKSCYCKGGTSSQTLQYTYEIDFSPLTSVNIKTTPDKKDKCTLQVTVTDEKGKPVKGESVTLKKPVLGKLSSLSVVTDSGGQAKVVYTAPTDEELEKLGKEEVNVLIEATDVKTGKSSSVEIHVRSKKRKIAAHMEHKILPAHPDYYNQIDFAFKAANKPNGNAYKAVITVNNNNGALVKNHGDKGGVKKLEMKVWPKNKYTFYYHWTGPTAMMKAQNEMITIEIPELKLKRKGSFSVGIDLAMVAITRRGGKVFPGILDPFNLFINDKFHPKTDLIKLFKEFHIKNIVIHLEQIEYNPPSYAGDMAQNGLLSSLLTRLEGSSSNSRQKVVVYNPGKWRIKKNKDGKYILFQTGKDFNGNLGVHYPSVIYRMRGSYKFKVLLKPEFAFDAIPKDNIINSKLYEVKYYRYFADDVFHTVFLPSYEFLSEAYIGFKGHFAFNLAISAKNVSKDLYNKDIMSAVIDVFGAFSTVAGKLNPAREKIVEGVTLASYAYTLATEVPDILSLRNGVTKIRSKTLKKTTDKRISKLFKICQLAAKGFKNQYLIIIKKKGINTYSASLGNGVRLEHIPQKIYKASKLSQRIDEGEKYIVISANKREKINLNLNGSGTPGEIIVITPDKIKSYKYPNRNWRSVIEIDKSGTATFKQGSEFLEELSTINNNENTNDNNFPTSINISGTWDTSWGKMVVKQNGNRITAHYTHDKGRLDGIIKGNVFIGKWSEYPTYKPHDDAGDVKLKFLQDGKSFSGNWRYGFGGSSWSGDWSGNKK